MQSKTNQKIPIEQLYDQAEKAMKDYVELAQSVNVPAQERPGLTYFLTSLLDYDAGNIYNYMITASAVLSALTDPKVSTPLFERIMLPHSDVLPKMLERLVYVLHELNGDDAAKSLIDYELKFGCLQLGPCEANRFQLELIISDYSFRLQRLQAIAPILEKINQNPPNPTV